MSVDLCPKCNSGNIYLYGDLWTCPDCAFEWMKGQAFTTEKEVAEKVVDMTTRDAHGNILSDGDSVIVLKDLKIKGASSSVKAGTKVRSIRLTDGDDGHNISCKIDGLGSLNLKSEFVKKA